jgi:hypothetical protein
VTCDFTCNPEPEHDLKLNTWQPGMPYLDNYFSTLRDMELLCGYDECHFTIAGHIKPRFEYFSVDDVMWGYCCPEAGNFHGEDRDLLVVVEVDLDEGERTDGNDDEEIDPGIFLVLNNDDDDSDGIPDYVDTDGVIGEDDMTVLFLALMPSSLPATHEVHLVWEAGANDYFRIFKNSDMTEQLYGNGENFNAIWEPDELIEAIPLYMDAIKPSPAASEGGGPFIIANYHPGGAGAVDSDEVSWTNIGVICNWPWCDQHVPLGADTYYRAEVGPAGGSYVWSMDTCPVGADYARVDVDTDSCTLYANTPGLYRQKLEYTYNGLTAQDVTVDMWYTGVEKLQWHVDTNPFEDVTGTVYIARVATAYFKALKDPSNAPQWPVAKPVWSGTSGVEGTGVETVSKEFSTASTSPTDYKTVIATCGNSKTANVIVVDAESISPSGGTYSVEDPLEFECSVTPTGGTYSWEVITYPQGADFDLADANTACPTLTSDTVGLYEVKLEYTLGGCTVSNTTGYITMD